MPIARSGFCAVFHSSWLCISLVLDTDLNWAQSNPWVVENSLVLVLSAALGAGSQHWSSQVAKPWTPVPSRLSLERRVWQNFLCHTPHGAWSSNCVASTTWNWTLFRVYPGNCLCWSSLSLHCSSSLLRNKLKISKNRNIFFQFSFGIFPRFLPNIPEFYCSLNIPLVLPSDVHEGWIVSVWKTVLFSSVPSSHNNQLMSVTSKAN